MEGADHVPEFVETEVTKEFTPIIHVGKIAGQGLLYHHVRAPPYSMTDRSARQRKSAQVTREDNLGPGTEEQGKNQEKLSGEELAQVFGKSLYEEKAKGPALLPELAVRLDEIFLIGFPEDLLKALVLKFPWPENCNLFEAPKLNELINFVVNSIILRDQRIIKRQENISASLSAIAGAISWVMKTKSTPGWKGTLETLSGASKIIADLQHDESVIRRNLILSNVNDSMKETLLATQIGEFLFGRTWKKR